MKIKIAGTEKIDVASAAGPAGTPYAVWIGNDIVDVRIRPNELIRMLRSLPTRYNFLRDEADAVEVVCRAILINKYEHDNGRE